MSRKQKEQDYNLRDYIWEEEEFKFNPKENRHKKFIHAKKRQLQKEHYANIKDKVIEIEYNIIQNKRAEADKYIAYEDYDFDEEDGFIRYKIK